MANQLDLEEQEQLDQIKHFWKQYGNVITWVLIVVMGAFASWNFYNYWQRSQAQQAAALFDEVDRAVLASDASRMDRVFSDMKDKFGGTAYAQQAGLLVARQYVALEKPDAAKAALAWVAEQSSDAGYQALARLRLAAISLESKNFEEALKLLNMSYPASFEALVADRKGDVLVLQGDKAKAVAEYEKAYRLFDARTEYRRLVEVKLNALGVDVGPQNQVATAAGK
ncbi:tetratricopeptide repeat protein [Rhodoferax sp.]|uniref:YfgM family protein n=1 Tax=Rhodoferax sp. TaxID=50421 RepID=UPI0026246DFA|nr:tetratricopeptide repeat protein [Rhodoferax sp.]MDD3935161.1 tetratricopeptide repeat protein [Rhodoferax sp.]